MTEAEAPPAPRPLWAINQMTAMEFSAFFAGAFEHSPWVAAKASLERPFPSKSAVLGAMAKAVAGAPEDDQLALLRAHPMLGGQAAKRGEVTASSRAEQAGLGLDRLEGDEEAAFAAMNLAYHRRFGFPFIIAVRGERDAERQAALAEVIKIASFRLDALIDDGTSAGSGRSIGVSAL
jgi:2-oxo-4-hydroxy-4-carboxy-5-ureidoimidazoline decarboxylase